MKSEKETTTKKKTVTKVVKGADFAVIMTGGKQYQVFEGDTLKVEKINDEMKEGDKISFDKVLLTDDGKNSVIGAPFVAGVKVSADVLEVGRAAKVTVIKYKQKSRYFKKRGHRQPYVKVKITAVK